MRTFISNSAPITVHSLALRSLFIVLSALVVIGEASVNWNTCADIISGQVAVYSGPALVNSQSAAFTYNLAYSLSSPTNPVAAAIGFTTFQTPNDQDFSIITNKTLTTTNLGLRVYMEDATVALLLKLNYIVMIRNSQTFRLLSDSFYPVIMNGSVGYRSESDLVNPSTAGDPFFTSTTLVSTVVLEGFRIIPHGAYIFIDSSINIPSPGVINVTFITFQDIIIPFIQYSVLFYDPVQADLTTQFIFQLGNIQFTNNSNLASTFFSNILPRYTAANRMFFGISSFNITINNDKYFGFDTTNYASLYSTYTFTTATITQITLGYYFFAQRSCAGTGALYFYNNWASPQLDDCVNSCATYDRPNNDPPNSQCLACDKTCLTCSGPANTDCQTCSPSNFRILAATAPTTCDCMTNYVEAGKAACVTCLSKFQGCLTCTTASCSTCMPGFTGPPPCSCSTGWIINSYCNTVYGCVNVSMINTTQTCINCNQTLLLQLSASFGCDCIFGTVQQPNQVCLPTCGDNYVLAVQGCDDGNLVSGDGCSSLCTVETNWRCVGALAQGSTCKINIQVTLTYIGVERDTFSNSGLFYFQFTPTFVQYQYINFNGLLATNLVQTSESITFQYTQNMLIATIGYAADIQNNIDQFQVLLNQSKYFWYPTTIDTIKVSGSNCELSFDQNFWLHTMITYTLLVLIAASIIIYIASIFLEKWIGLELIQTFQSCYYLFSFIQSYPFQFSGHVQNLRYSNGFDDILSSSYYRVHTLPNSLVALGIQKEFISNYNVLYLLTICAAIVLLAIGLRKRKLNQALEETISSDINKKLKKINKVFAFIFSRIFMMLVFFSMFKIIFSFSVQLGNDQSIYQFFPDELNVAAGILAFVIVFTMITYILNWFLLLPNNFTEDQEFMNVSFQNMSFYYPVLYLAYQTIFILIISVINTISFTQYFLLSLQIVYFGFILFIRPYNTVRGLNRFIHNFTILYNQFVTIFVLIVVIRWNSIVGTSYQTQSNYELTGYSILILIFLLFAVLLAILRLVIFNREVSFKCCKKQEQTIQEINYQSMKKVQREQGVLGHDQKHIQMAILSSFREKKDNSHEIVNREHSKRREDEKRVNRVTREPIDMIKQEQVDLYLNENNIHWNPRRLMTENAPKVTYQNIKKTSSGKKAELKKSSLEMYMQLKAKQKQIAGLVEHHDQI